MSVCSILCRIIRTYNTYMLNRLSLQTIAKKGEKFMTKISLQDYKQLGGSIKIVNRNLRLILKILMANDIDPDTLRTERDFFDKAVQITADLSNMASTLDDTLSIDYPEQITETIEYFN